MIIRSLLLQTTRALYSLHELSRFYSWSSTLRLGNGFRDDMGYIECAHHDTAVTTIYRIARGKGKPNTLCTFITELVHFSIIPCGVGKISPKRHMPPLLSRGKRGKCFLLAGEPFSRCHIRNVYESDAILLVRYEHALGRRVPEMFSTPDDWSGV